MKKITLFFICMLCFVLSGCANVGKEQESKLTKTPTVSQSSTPEPDRVSPVLKLIGGETIEIIAIWALENGYTFLTLDATSPGMHHSINN